MTDHKKNECNQDQSVIIQNVTRASHYCWVDLEMNRCKAISEQTV